MVRLTAETEKKVGASTRAHGAEADHHHNGMAVPPRLKKYLKSLWWVVDDPGPSCYMARNGEDCCYMDAVHLECLHSCRGNGPQPRAEEHREAVLNYGLPNVDAAWLLLRGAQVRGRRPYSVVVRCLPWQHSR